MQGCVRDGKWFGTVCNGSISGLEQCARVFKGCKRLWEQCAWVVEGF